MPRQWKHLYMLPLCVFLSFVCTFFTTYGIAVYYGHVKPDFPYISDGGTCPPESCIFGQMLNITALLLGITVYIRYSLVDDYYSAGARPAHWKRWTNRAGLMFGVAGALGMSMVGNFQESNLNSVHLVGAVMAFFFGVLYCWTQLPITYATRPEMTHPVLFWVRVLITSLCTLLFFTGWGCSAAMPREFTESLQHSLHNCNASVIPVQVWNDATFGWRCHICATASEWTLALLFAGFMLSMVYEFRLITIEKPKMVRVASVRRQRDWVHVSTLYPPPPAVLKNSHSLLPVPTSTSTASVTATERRPKKMRWVVVPDAEAETQACLA